MNRALSLLSPLLNSESEPGFFSVKLSFVLFCSSLCSIYHGFSASVFCKNFWHVPHKSKIMLLLNLTKIALLIKILPIPFYTLKKFNSKPTKNMVKIDLQNIMPGFRV